MQLVTVLELFRSGLTPCTWIGTGGSPRPAAGSGGCSCRGTPGSGRGTRCGVGRCRLAGVYGCATASVQWNCFSRREKWMVLAVSLAIPQGGTLPHGRGSSGSGVQDIFSLWHQLALSS